LAKRGNRIFKKGIGPGTKKSYPWGVKLSGGSGKGERRIEKKGPFEMVMGRYGSKRTRAPQEGTTRGWGRGTLLGPAFLKKKKEGKA